MPELNFTGQFAGWLRVNTDLSFHAYHKDEGIPFLTDEIFQQIMNLTR